MLSLPTRYCFCVFAFFGILTALAHAIGNDVAKSMFAFATLVFLLLTLYFWKQEGKEEKIEELKKQEEQRVSRLHRYRPPPPIVRKSVERVIEKNREVFDSLATPRRRRIRDMPIPKKAIHQDHGKFFKRRKGQSLEYYKSTKKHTKKEELDEL